MRIEPKVVTPVAQETRDPKPAADKPTPAAVVKLSAAGTSAASQTETHAASASRIAEIRAAVRRGAYPIDLDKLAAKIIDDEVVRGRG